jgi:hypothetical protein
MPVPVPRHSNQVAHPVIKTFRCGDTQIPNLAHTLPAAPTCPPPSFGTREQWISSLPSWRRTKPRRIWEDDSRLADKRVKQDFHWGLTAAGNASVIKGTHADACIPPFTSQPPAEIEMTPDRFTMSHGQWGTRSPVRSHDNIMVVEEESRDIRRIAMISAGSSYGEQGFERGAFSPIFEDESPGATGLITNNSPLEPLTPFGDFVDHAVATAQSSADYLAFVGNTIPRAADMSCQAPSCHMVPEEPKEPVPAPAPEAVTPSATSGYRKLAEPLSDWVANYVWQVCTNGLSLPSLYSRPS